MTQERSTDGFICSTHVSGRAGPQLLFISPSINNAPFPSNRASIHFASRLFFTLSGRRGAKQLVVVTTHKTFSAPQLSSAALTASTSVTTASPCAVSHEQPR